MAYILSNFVCESYEKICERGRFSSYVGGKHITPFVGAAEYDENLFLQNTPEATEGGEACLQQESEGSGLWGVVCG